MQDIMERVGGSQYRYHEESVLTTGENKYSSTMPSMVGHAYQASDGHQLMKYPSVRVARESRRSIKVTSGEVFLFAVGAACIVAGTVTPFWPVALAGAGPCLLALLDISERMSRRE